MAIVALLAPRRALADSNHSGFTLELGTGVGAFASFQIDGDNVIEPALAPVSIRLGGFVSNRIAIMAQASALFFTYSPASMSNEGSALESSLTRSFLVGATVQWWLSDSWALETGAGLSLLGNGPVESQLNRGLGLSMGLSRSLMDAAGGTLSAVWEVSPSFYSRRETTLSSTIGLKWQLP